MCLLAHWEYVSTHCSNVIVSVSFCVNKYVENILRHPIRAHFQCQSTSSTCNILKNNTLRRCLLTRWEYFQLHCCSSTLIICDVFQLAYWECAWTPCQSTFSMSKHILNILILQNKHVENEPTSMFETCSYTLSWDHTHRCFFPSCILIMCFNTLSKHILNLKAHSQPAKFLKINVLRRCLLLRWECASTHCSDVSGIHFVYFFYSTLTPYQSTFSI